MDVILNLAPTGMVPTRAQTALVPLTPSEVIDDVTRCAEVGITSVHLHARDEDGVPTHRKEVYAEMIGGIRAAVPDLVVCVSCSGRNVSDVERRSEVLDLEGELRPDMASLTLASMNFSGSASLNAPEVVQQLATRMKERGIQPELEIFDLGMANYAKFLLDRGFLQPPLYANVFFGNIATAQATLLEMGAVLNALPDGCTWSFAGFGADQLRVNATAIANGGGVRTGIEDNIWWDAERTRHASNLELVERTHELARVNGRKVMTPSTFRALLGLGG
jgi:3-keto-5-aminohexanoate cleavage enzyme